MVSSLGLRQQGLRPHRAFSGGKANGIIFTSVGIGYAITPIS
jgi:hypothetical protein